MVEEFLVTPQDKEPVLSLLWLRFDPWPSLSHTKNTDQKKKKKEEIVEPKGEEKARMLQKHRACRAL